MRRMVEGAGSALKSRFMYLPAALRAATSTKGGGLL